MSSNGSSTSDVNKDDLYGKFQTVEDWNRERLKWQNELHKKAAYKHLDIGDPDDVGDINVTGVDAKGIAQIVSSMIPQPQPKASSPLKWLALAAGVGIPAMMAPSIIEAVKTEPAPVVIEQQPFEDTDTDTQYELQFFED